MDFPRKHRPIRLDVYTDGACSGAPGPGGWAWAVASTPPGKAAQDSGFESGTTNQRMELQAALEASLYFERRTLITIVTDSAYVMNCFTQKWHLGWKNGRKRSGEPVSNWDIWSELIPLVLARETRFRKVKGHSGDPMNDYVDQLAVTARLGKSRARLRGGSLGRSVLDEDWSGARYVRF